MSTQLDLTAGLIWPMLLTMYPVIPMRPLLPLLPCLKGVSYSQENSPFVDFIHVCQSGAHLFSFRSSVSLWARLSLITLLQIKLTNHLISQ